MDLDGLHGWLQDYFAAWVSSDVLMLTFAPDRRCKDHREWLVVRELPD